MSGFDQEAYMLGRAGGYSKGYDAGYAAGEQAGSGEVVIEGSVTCTDPNNDGNVVITEG